ncbi:AKR_collapsed_G0047340.mRNA.1.CDS.1 [Saccharomyces cerevisiae]|nr:AKR_collapsed_G0047340.mRNA.1.CDS.1 [Saccharomyces cerevisiae]
MDHPVLSKSVGKMTKDLALMLGKTNRSSYVTTEEFIDEVAKRLQNMMLERKGRQERYVQTTKQIKAIGRHFQNTSMA